MNRAARWGILLHTFAGAALIAGIFCLVWRQGNVNSGSVKISEVFFGAAILAVVLIALLKQYSRGELERLKPDLRRIFPLLALLIAGAVIGGIFSMLHFPQWQPYRAQMVLEFARILFAMALFLLTAYLTANRPALLRGALYAVSSSALVLWTALLPTLQDLMLVGGRLRGPESDPNYLGTWLVLCVVIDACFFLYGTRRQRSYGLALLFFTVPLLLWTGSRGALVAVAAAGAALIIYHLKRNGIQRGAPALGAGLVVLALSFSFATLVLPAGSTRMVDDRIITPTVTGHNIGYGQNRGELAILGIKKLAVFPLGLGPAYVNWQPLATLEDGRIYGPHDLFLETGLTAGVLGLAALALFLWLVLARCVQLLRGRPAAGNAALAFGFFGVLVGCLFLDTLTLRWLWLLAGLIIAAASGAAAAQAQDPQ